LPLGGAALRGEEQSSQPELRGDRPCELLDRGRRLAEVAPRSLRLERLGMMTGWSRNPNYWIAGRDFGATDRLR
jgi:hypothetical protein